MSYRTTNEFHHFEFFETHIGNLWVMDGVFHIVLDNVKILPENSCNRDIRKMRCNELELRIENPRILRVVREGYTLCDANGRMKEQIADEILTPEQYPKVWEVFLDAEVYSAEKQEQNYCFVVDASDERTYSLLIEGSGDAEQWERFLNL